MIFQIGGSSKLRKDRTGIWYINANRDGANEFINGVFNLSGFVPKQWQKKRQNDKSGKKRANAWINEMGLKELADNIAKKRVNMNSNNNRDIHGNLYRGGSISLGKDTEIAKLLDELYVIAGNKTKTLENYIFYSSISASLDEFNRLPSRIRSKKNAKTDESISEERENALDYINNLVVNSRRLVNQKHKIQNPTSTPQSIAHENRAKQSKKNSDDEKKKRATSRKIKSLTKKDTKRMEERKESSKKRVQNIWGDTSMMLTAINSKSKQRTSKKEAIKCMECGSDKSPTQFSESQRKKKPNKRKCIECTSSMNTKKSGKGSKKKKRRETKKAKKRSNKKTRKKSIKNIFKYFF